MNNTLFCMTIAASLCMGSWGLLGGKAKALASEPHTPQENTHLLEIVQEEIQACETNLTANHDSLSPAASLCSEHITTALELLSDAGELTANETLSLSAQLQLAGAGVGVVALLPALRILQIPAKALASGKVLTTGAITGLAAVITTLTAQRLAHNITTSAGQASLLQSEMFATTAGESDPLGLESFTTKYRSLFNHYLEQGPEHDKKMLPLLERREDQEHKQFKRSMGQLSEHRNAMIEKGLIKSHDNPWTVEETLKAKDFPEEMAVLYQLRAAASYHYTRWTTADNIASSAKARSNFFEETGSLLFWQELLKEDLFHRMLLKDKNNPNFEDEIYRLKGLIQTVKNHLIPHYKQQIENHKITDQSSLKSTGELYKIIEVLLKYAEARQLQLVRLQVTVAERNELWKQGSIYGNMYHNGLSKDETQPQ